MRVCVCVCVCARARACSDAQSCLTLFNSMDWIPLGFSVHEIFQARILEWVAISYSAGSSWPKDWTHIYCVSSIGRWILFRSSVCLLMLCLLDLSVTERVLLKCPTITINLSIFYCSLWIFLHIFWCSVRCVHIMACYLGASWPLIIM